MMRFIFSATLIFLLTAKIFSQQTGTIQGTVTDSTNNASLSFASVAVIDETTNKVTTGANTDEQGKFIIEDVPFGTYKIELTYIGYNTLVIPDVMLTSQNNSIKLGNIKMKSGAATTEEIEVKGQKSTIEFRGDRRILNVGENLVLKGATGLDVLKEVPGVTVDIDGNVSVRGSEGIKIMIDGKPFGLEGANRTTTLEQLSADQIDRVELVTNPSVKYDAEGSSGIINIILKKQLEYGYNGTLSLNAGTSDKYSGGLNMNLRKDKLNLNGSYNYNKMDFNSTRNSSRTYFSALGDYVTSQEGSGIRRREGHNFKGGLDYSISKLSSLGLNLSYRDGKSFRSETTHSTETDITNTLITDFYRRTNSESRGDNLEMALNFSQRFGKDPGHKLTSDFTFSNEPDNEITYSNDEDVIPLNPTPEMLKEIDNEKDRNYQLSLNYELPLSKETKFEAGYKGVYKQSDNDFTSSLFNYNTSQYDTNPLLSNRFKYDQIVNGLYTSISGNVLNFSYLLGGRLEHTDTKGELLTTNFNFDKSYLEFFPSVSISRKLGVTQEIQASYSKRVRRPRESDLNPFLKTDDRYNITTGNPNLKPEFTNSFELNYINYLNIGTFTPSLFFRRTTDEITRVRTLVDSVTTLTTFENLNASNSYGAEFLISSQPTSGIGINGNISYYKTDVTGSTGSGIERSAYSWSSRLTTNLALPMDFGLQVSYAYSGKRVTSQGIFRPMQSLDAALKKDFMDKKLTLSLRVSDILNTSNFTYNITDPLFVETAERRRDSRNVFLNVSYKFGTDEKNKRSGKKQREDNNDDDGDYDY
ncbi:MAG: TonB-dependent receptor [bacterium]